MLSWNIMNQTCTRLVQPKAHEVLTEPSFDNSKKKQHLSGTAIYSLWHWLKLLREEEEAILGDVNLTSGQDAALKHFRFSMSL